VCALDGVLDSLFCHKSERKAPSCSMTGNVPELFDGVRGQSEPLESLAPRVVFGHRSGPGKLVAGVGVGRIGESKSGSSRDASPDEGPDDIESLGVSPNESMYGVAPVASDDTGVVGGGMDGHGISDRGGVNSGSSCRGILANGVFVWLLVDENSGLSENAPVNVSESLFKICGGDSVITEGRGLSMQ
jgi:hypothetical protein